MSMCLAMHTLSDENIRRLLADPPLVWKIIAPDDPEVYADARARDKPQGLLSRLFGRKQAPAATPVTEDLPLADNEVASTDLDKAWHGIHYLLTQTAWDGDAPLNFLVKNGQPVGDIDVGYGPARAFTAAQVQAIHAALAPLDGAFLKSRFNPDQMMKLGIYPEIWDRDPADDDTFGYCAEYFTTLKTFVATAAERNTGLLVHLC
jgi:Domain of unknown function (DUF1877)